MSSILSALKKVERRQDTPLVSAAGATAPRQSLHRLFQPSRRRLRPWGWALTVALMVAAALLFEGIWRRTDRLSPPAVQAPLIAPKQTPVPQAKLPPKARKAIRRPPKMNPARAARRKAPLATPAVRPQAAPPARPGKSPSMPPAEKTNAPDALTPLPADAGLTLQALVWAPEPARRFTVINNRIVREGGSIDGMTVVRIGETQVVLQKDGALWRLGYNRQP